MTDAELTDLLDKARKATPGPWKADMCGDVYSVSATKIIPELDDLPMARQVAYRPIFKCDDPDSAFISAANPAVVIVLVEEVQRLRSLSLAMALALAQRDVTKSPEGGG